MKILKSNSSFRVVMDDTGNVTVEFTDLDSNGDIVWSSWSYPYLILDYIKELMEKIDDLENELIEYGEMEM